MKLPSWLNSGEAIGIAVVAVVAIVFVMVLRGPGGNGEADQSGYVKVACHDWVKDRLKSPASAKFSGDQVARNGEQYVVSGAVDSQNSFGAMIRNTYECTATHSGDGTRLVSITGLAN